MRRALFLVVIALAACGPDESAVVAPERDPASEQALADLIMVDPDLANQNEGNAALTVSSDHALPLIAATDESVAAARAEAALLVGGSDKLVTPPPARALPGGDRDAFATAATLAAALPEARNCVGTIDYSAVWAARLPIAFPVYPRGATIDAAGSEACALRVVTFVTPVPPTEVLAFYATRARQARYTVEHAADGAEHRLAASKHGAQLRLRLRPRDDGLTEVKLVTFGG